MILVTHSGSAHADELFAYAILGYLYPEAELIRTRVQDVIDTGDIIFDVGGKFDGIRHFDHHQLDAELREDGTKYSAFGLIWKFFGKEFIRQILEAEKTPFDEGETDYDNNDVQIIWETIDLGIVHEIDCHDNGLKKSEIAKFLGFATGGSDESFKESAAFARKFLVKKVIELLVATKDTATIEKGYVTDDGTTIILGERIVDFDSLKIYPFWNTLRFVIMPRGEGYWQALCIRDDPDNSFVNRKALSSIGAGLQGKSLEEATGLEGMIFVHPARFIAVATNRWSLEEYVRWSVKDEE